MDGSVHEGGPSVVEVLGVVEGIVAEGLGETDIVGAEQLAAELGGDLVKDMAPAALALAADGGDLFLIHFEIGGEGGFSGEDPGPPPIPPLPHGTAGVLAHGGYGFGAAERPCGGGGGRRLDLQIQGERGKPAADPGAPPF
ncbi:hypothetical protein C2S53_017938 [Perilla frutescens var. hirtella]|uniref:Uncharacterized protein n=1 Tax=Perilla frutescens var. hirtella TaxID=608512 RepID=A0AAD4IXR8_PERFH|nr:hypothetical protein C2S53_017938 [Perilla frutescens var. hirtella]